MDYLAARIISFGCSFTQYLWPTYADILQAENLGWPGSGNERIFYFILEQYKKHQFKNYDLITVQWTGPLRFDYLTRDGWTEADGPLRLSKVNKHIWRSVKNWFNENYEEEKTQNYKIVIDKLLASTGVKYFITDIDYMRELYIGGYEFNNATPWTKNSFIDKHPTIMQHMDFANKIASDNGLEIDKTIHTKCNDLHATISKDKVFEQYKL